MGRAQVVQDLIHTFDQIPEGGVISRTIYHDEQAKITLLGLPPEQKFDTPAELAESPATLQFLQGEGHVMIEEQTYPVQPGSWLRLGAEQGHQISANSEMVVVYTVIKNCE